MSFKTDAQKLLFQALWEKQVSPAVSKGQPSVTLKDEYSKEEAISIQEAFSLESFRISLSSRRERDSDGDAYGDLIYKVTVYI